MASLKSLVQLSALILPLTLVACGGDENSGAAPDAGPDDDIDQDGFTPNQGDCNDDNRSIYPGAPDPCDGIDQNCDGVADELFDQDKDNFTTCGGDCRDNDPNSNPGAVEVVDGFDNDCDGIADNNTPQYDDDGDGYSDDQGDCNDNPNMGGALIGPDAIEVQFNEDGEPEGNDNDCDGIVDEAIEPCPADLALTDPMAYASAMDICHEVINATIPAAADARGRTVRTQFGNTYVPNLGPSMTLLHTGLAVDMNDANFDDYSVDLGVEVPHPDPQAAVAGCGSADEDTVNDYNEVSLAIQVPQNAQAFSFDFNFMSHEFPEFVCTSFDDTFLAYLESDAFTGNVSFDAMGNRVSINVGFFNVCDPSLDASCTSEDDLVGTSFAVVDNTDEGGGTGWLTTTAPVVPGEKIRLTFMIFDEGDHSWDSAVLIDNFRWELEPVDGPITVERVYKEPVKGSSSDIAPIVIK